MAYKDRDKQREYQNAWLKQRRQEWVDIHGPCVDCGGSDRLEVDHVDPEKKVSHRVWSWSKVRRETELKKCVVRCCQCHHDKSHLHTYGPKQHGTKRMYDHPCRCQTCKDGQNTRMRDFYARRRSSTERASVS